MENLWTEQRIPRDCKAHLPNRKLFSRDKYEVTSLEFIHKFWDNLCQPVKATYFSMRSQLLLPSDNLLSVESLWTDQLIPRDCKGQLPYRKNRKLFSCNKHEVTSFESQRQHEHAWWRRLDVERFAASYLLTEYCTYGSVSLDSFLTNFFQFFSVWLSSLHKWNKGDFEVRTWTRSANEWTLMNVTMKLVGYIRRL